MFRAMARTRHMFKKRLTSITIQSSEKNITCQILAIGVVLLKSFSSCSTPVLVAMILNLYDRTEVLDFCKITRYSICLILFLILATCQNNYEMNGT